MVAQLASGSVQNVETRQVQTSDGDRGLFILNRFDPSVRTVGRCDEWHLSFFNSFCHFTFDDVSWFSEEGVMFGSSFS